VHFVACPAAALVGGSVVSLDAMWRNGELNHFCPGRRANGPAGGPIIALSWKVEAAGHGCSARSRPGLISPTSLADRKKLPHVDLPCALTAPLQFTAEITKRVTTDSNPAHRGRPATQRGCIRVSALIGQCSHLRPACTPGVNAPRTPFFRS
jgi:hypothetical protein